jgi:hypothetical protein
MNRLVPIRYRLPDGHGGFVKTPLSFQSLTTTAISCPAGGTVINEVGSGNPGPTYDPTTGAFTYTWHTGFSLGCRRLTFKLRDGKSYSLNFKITQ